MWVDINLEVVDKFRNLSVNVLIIVFKNLLLEILEVENLMGIGKPINICIIKLSICVANR
jgi:hypothetical protein